MQTTGASVLSIKSYRRTLVAPALAPQPQPAPTPSPSDLVRARIAQNLSEPASANDSALLGLNGGQIFAELLREHGVKHVFGYPGGAILPVFDGIYQSKDFDLILPRHEQGAGHMAEGYARATGKVGVVVVTSGPGATNTVTAMQDAFSDGTPLIVFTGQVPTTAIGSDAFQEADVLGISRFCTKWNVMVKDIADLPRIMRQAFLIAQGGRPGPVLVDLPKDVTSSTLVRATTSQPSIPSFYKYQLNPAGRRKEQEELCQRAAEMINVARRPVFYVGQGATEYSALVRQIAGKGRIPVTTTLQAMGVFDELNPLSLHMLGMHGSAYANHAMQNADCIVAIGARFDDRVTGNIKKFAPAARRAAKEGRGGIIHLEIMSKNINKTVQTDIAIEGDCGESVKMMLNHIVYDAREEWHQLISGWKRAYPFSYLPALAVNSPLKPQAVIAELDRQLQSVKERVIITTGVGQHQMWAAQWYRWRHPRTFITSGGLGTMGYGLPAAIGAKIARPDMIVIDIDGDASLSMTAMELMTAREFDVGVKVLVLNNNFQGMVKQWQDLFYNKRYSGTPMKNPNWSKFAESMNCRGISVKHSGDLSAAIAAFLAEPGPVLLEAVVDEDEHVYPMVPAGKALDEMVLAPIAPA